MIVEIFNRVRLNTKYSVIGFYYMMDMLDWISHHKSKKIIYCGRKESFTEEKCREILDSDSKYYYDFNQKTLIITIHDDQGKLSLNSATPAPFIIIEKNI